MRAKLFDLLTRLVGGSPWLVLLAALLLSFTAIAVSSNLKMETRILDLLPKGDPAAVEFDNIVRQYSSASQIMVGVEGGSRDTKVAFAKALKERAGEIVFTDKTDGTSRPYIKRVDLSFDKDFVEKHAMMLSKVRDLENLEELFTDLGLADLLMAYNDFFEREYIEDSSSVTEREKEDRAISSLKGLVEWLEGIEKVDDGDKALEKYADRVTDLLTTGDRYMFSGDDSMLIVTLIPSISMDRMDEMLAGVESLKNLIEDIRKDFPDLEVRAAGMPVMCYEEEEATIGDMGISSMVSLVLILALFVLAFRMWTAPLLAVINLIVGIIWTTGFIAIVFGRLNIMTMMFAVILLGLGIDFAIHLNASFSTARSEGKSIPDSLAAMYRRSGAGVITGALTTSVAFLALALTGLEAFIELGIVLGAGILFTLVASLTILPAMWVVHERIARRLRKGKERKSRPVRLAFPFLESSGRGMARRPWIFVGIMVALTAGALLLSRTAKFETDMLELEPPDMPSVTLHRDILKKFELHPDSTLVTTASLEKTAAIVKKMKKNRLVGQVDAITEFIPSPKEQKKRARIAKRVGEHMRGYLEPKVTIGLAGVPAFAQPPEYMSIDRVDPEEVKRFALELDRLQMNVQEMSQLAFASVKKRLQQACDRLTGGDQPEFSRILAVVKALNEGPDPGHRMAQYQRAYIPLLAHKIEKMSDTSPITLDTLPESIKERYFSVEGNNLITIYSSVDLWKEDKMDLFISAMAKVTDRATGSVVLMDRLIELVGSKGLMATYLALGAVFIILLIDFRHFGYALLGVVPLVTGFIWMIGLFILAGRSFDVNNVMAIPLILGIGIDDAVHVLHAIKRRGIQSAPQILKHTGRALVLTSLTTGIAFGSIAFASHRGMAGMGLLLVMGVAGCLMTSLFLLPPLARIFLKDKESNIADMEVRHA